MLSPGDRAPDFHGTLADGRQLRLRDFRGRRHVILYFFPKDFTPGCTKEACGFRDNYDAIAAYDAVIVGVSGDSEGSHASFREKYDLPFPLIADPDKELLTKYDARGGLLAFMPPRVTYVIDKEGVIRAAMRHDLFVGRHVGEVLEALASFASPAATA